MKGNSGDFKTDNLKVKEEILRKYGFEESSNAWSYTFHNTGQNYIFRKTELTDIPLKDFKEILNGITKITQRAKADSRMG